MDYKCRESLLTIAGLIYATPNVALFEASYGDYEPFVSFCRKSDSEEERI